jgi:hypothetical protein
MLVEKAGILIWKILFIILIFHHYNISINNVDKNFLSFSNLNISDEKIIRIFGVVNYDWLKMGSMTIRFEKGNYDEIIIPS